MVSSTMFEPQPQNTSLPVQQESHTISQPLLPMPHSVIPQTRSHDITIEQVKMKYHKFHSVGKIGLMAVELCREAIFGDEIMKKSTVKGCRNLPPLPEDGLRVPKKPCFLFSHSTGSLQHLLNHCGQTPLKQLGSVVNNYKIQNNLLLISLLTMTTGAVMRLTPH